MQHKIKLLNKEDSWHRLRNYKPNDTVNHNNKLWQNVTGLNSEPNDISKDWFDITLGVAGATDLTVNNIESDENNNISIGLDDVAKQGSTINRTVTVSQNGGKLDLFGTNNGGAIYKDPLGDSSYLISGGIVGGTQKVVNGDFPEPNIPMHGILSYRGLEFTFKSTGNFNNRLKIEPERVSAGASYTLKLPAKNGIIATTDDIQSPTIGSINPTTDTTSLANGLYNTQISGNYPNAGNIVVKEGYYTILRNTNNVWSLESEVKMPMQDLTILDNRITTTENKVDDFIENYAVVVDQEFDVESTNSIANKRVTKRTSLLERLEDEATKIIVNEYTETKYSGFTEFHAKFSSNLSGAGYIDHNNIYKKDDTTRRAYKDVLIPENTFKIEIKNIASSVSSANPAYCCFGLKRLNGVFDVIIDGINSSTTTRQEASVELVSKSYTHFSLTVYNNDSLFTISFFNAEGEIIEKIDKNYLYNKLNNETSSSYANPIGTIKDVSSISLPSGYNTLYYPFIITTEKIQNPKGKYYMYFSTDHDTDANGKIGMFYSDNLVDWTFHGNIITSSSFGGLKQPETPCVVWSDDLKKYLMYFHVSSDYNGSGYAQTTLIAESADGLSFSYVKPAFNIPMNRMKGDGHNGYFSCQKINGIYKGVSLFGGTDIDFRAIHFSKDGLNWITHQKEANTVAPSNYFFRQNSLCRISLSDVVSESGAGGVAGSYKTFSMSYCTDDMEVIGSEIIGNILPSGEGQVVSSISTSVINGEVYILCVYSKTKIVIKKIV